MDRYLFHYKYVSVTIYTHNYRHIANLITLTGHMHITLLLVFYIYTHMHPQYVYCICVLKRLEDLFSQYESSRASKEKVTSIACCTCNMCMHNNESIIARNYLQQEM